MKFKMGNASLTHGQTRDLEAALELSGLLVFGPDICDALGKECWLADIGSCTG